MARTVTLASLITQAQQRADMENSQFISTSEWTSYINASAAELYDLLVGAFEDYYVSSATLSIIAGTDTYSLPASFYKLLGVDAIVDAAGNAITLNRFVFSERNNYLFTPSFTAFGMNTLRYHLQGGSIRFVPVPSTTQTLKLWYVPAQTPMTDTADTLDGVNGWEEYVVIDAAMKALIKEESDVSALMAQKEAIKRRIESMSQNRDAGMPERVGDITQAVPYEFWGFSGEN